MMDWLGWAALTWTVNAMMEGLAIAALAWALVRVLPRANAATRYAVWLAALAAMIAIPLLAPPAPAGPAVAAGPATSAVVTLPAPGAWPLYLIGLWCVVALGRLLALGGGYVAMQRLKRRAAPVPHDIQGVFEELLAAFPGRRAPQVRLSCEVAAPVAAGLFRPAILIPEKLLHQLSAAETTQVLAHELAHLRRGDDWTNLIQKLIEAVFVFHPAVWIAGHRLNIERELACDDWVVTLTGRPRPYAACLTKLAELRLPARGPQLAPGVVARKRQIVTRIEALLEARRNTSPRFSKSLVAGAACVMVVAVAAGGRYAPVEIAQPALAALPASMPNAAPAVETAYARPPKPAPRTSTVEAPVQAQARPNVPYLLVQEWRLNTADHLNASYCIFYFESNHTSWLRVVWIERGAPRVVLHGA